MYLFGTGLLLLSCTPKEEVDNRLIDIASAMSAPAELKASDYFRKVRYIPLETSDNSLVGPGVNIKVLKNTILVTSSQKQCLLFDKNDGKFIRSIGHVGNDPGGYRDVVCRVDESNDLLLFPGWGNDIISYDMNGNYVGKIAMPAVEGSETFPGAFFSLNGDTLVGYYSNRMGNEVNRILYFDRSGQFLSVIPNRESPIPFEIAAFSMWKGEKAIEEYGPFAAEGVMFLEGQEVETASVDQMVSSVFWHTGKKTYFKEAFNDTIYQVTGTGLQAEILFDPGEYAWTYPNRFQKKPDKRIYISQLLDREDLLLFRFITGLYNDDNRKLYNGVFNKKTGQTVISPLIEGIKDDIMDFMSYQPLTVSSLGEYAGVIPAEEIVLWFDKHTDRLSDLPEELQSLQHIGEEDNPVVVILE